MIYLAADAGGLPKTTQTSRLRCSVLPEPLTWARHVK
jgi:hypothetical protein